MKVTNTQGRIIIPANTNPWPHEIRVAKILANAGHIIEFIPEGTIGTADIYLDGITFEIKSPKSSRVNTIEHRIKDAIRTQSHNLIIDSSRTKYIQDRSLRNWLINKCRVQPQIQRLLFVDKKGNIVDIKSLI